jgi:hypothetical protein
MHPRKVLEKRKPSPGVKNEDLKRKSSQLTSLNQVSSNISIERIEVRIEVGIWRGSRSGRLQNNEEPTLAEMTGRVGK